MPTEFDNIYGIYKLISDSGKQTKDGHKLYVVECMVCHRLFERSKKEFAYNYIVTRCCHNFKNFKSISNKRLRRIFKGMYSRCYNKNDKDYHNYGKKGIYICDEWLMNLKKFEKWSNKNGYDDTLSIDRIDNDGPYAPWNCRWVKLNINAKFRSKTNVFEIDGIVDSGKGWSARLNLPINYINNMTKKYGKDFTKRYIKNRLNGFITLKPKVKNVR